MNATERINGGLHWIVLPASLAHIETTVTNTTPPIPSDQPTDLLTLRVWSVVPCFNRPGDLMLLLQDLSRLELAFDHADRNITVDLRVIVIDNASDSPLTPESTRLPDSLRADFVRLDSNVGGSGGFNAGLRRAIQNELTESTSPSFVWLVDSDARVAPRTLRHLVEALLENPSAAAVGSSIADPRTGQVFEVGGLVDRHNGRFGPVARGVAGIDQPIECDYVAACSALVRMQALLATGLMPDVFLNADDVEWFIRMRQVTGHSVLASAKSIAMHPRFDRFATAARYYVARNALGPLRALGLSRNVKMRRAMHEVIRAARMEMCGRDDLSRLHLVGLRDSIDAPTGPAPSAKLRHKPFAPLASLAGALTVEGKAPAGMTRIVVDAGLMAALSPFEQETLNGQVAVLMAQNADSGVDLLAAQPGALRKLKSLLVRLVLGPAADVAIVNAKGLVPSWFAGKAVVKVSPGAGFVVRQCDAGSRWSCVARAVKSLARGTHLAWRAARAAATKDSRVIPSEHVSHAPDIANKLTLSIIVLSHNRRDTLRSTLARLRSLPELTQAEIIVVDNASSDGSAAMVRELCGVQLVALETNVGVDALNTGVTAATGDVVLVLDDDAWPESRAVAGAMEILSRRPDLAAVTLHPHHPVSRRSEWSFAHALHGNPDDRWPVMGCGNLVRRDAWLRAGGYEKDYFLYRNDTDLALKLLSMRGGPSRVRMGVYFDPTWIVWHDSPAAARKSERWHFLATKNWVWTARRHGRGVTGVTGLLLGWAWAHRLSGVSVKRHVQTLRGIVRGVSDTPPRLPRGVEPTGADFAKLLGLHVGRMRR